MLLIMIYLKIISTFLVYLSLSFAVKAAVQVEQLDFNSLLLNDCPQSVATISVSNSASIAQQSGWGAEFSQIVQDSILVANLPSLFIDASKQNYSHSAFPNKSITFSSSRSKTKRYSYAWHEKSFEWLSAYSSNQSDLEPPPFFALARYQQQTFAIASVSVYEPQDLLKVLNDDFVVNRSPLLLFLNSSKPVNNQHISQLNNMGFRLHQQQTLLLASKDLNVCDSGFLNENGQHQLAWLKVDLNQ